MLETCLGLLPSTEDQTEANRQTLADFAGPISVGLAITHSDSIVQMRLCCLKGHLLANLSSYCKCLQDGLSRVRSEPQCLAAILDQINFNLSVLQRRPGDLVHLVCDLIEQCPVIVAFDVDIEMGPVRQESKMRIAA